MKKITGIFTVLLFAVSIYSQFPEMMGYQAIIRNTDNQLVTNKEVGMQISILEGSATGTPVYVETHSPTTNANGLFSIEIGKGTATFGEFANINWETGTLFIKSETDPMGGTDYSITVTSQLVSVPYAFHAKTVTLTNVLRPPSGSNQAATEIQPYTVTLNATVNANGLMTTVMFEWGLTTEYGYTATAIPGFVKAYDDITVTANIAGLQPNTTYHYRIKAINAVDMFFSEDMSFVTSVTVPQVTTVYVQNILAFSADASGTITSDGGSPVTARGVCWSTSHNPTLEDNYTTDESVDGWFSSSLTSLSPNTTYYVRSYASNAIGTSYGNEINFTTQSGEINLTTLSANNILAFSAMSGGYIYNDGGSPVTARGVCWSTSQNPTVENNLGKTTNGIGTGAFTSSIAGLEQNTTYYVRAYATNSMGTQYGNQVSFSTIIADGTTGTVTYNGYTYKTVYIDCKEWFAENLQTTKYNDGTDIPLVTDNDEWSHLSTPAYCWYNNDRSAYGNIYGALYNWYTVNTGKLCPDGWHVPTNTEWTGLTNYLGGASVAGGKLKETGTAHWASPNTGATNESGFAALPGGYRNLFGTFSYVGSYGYWWSAPENDAPPFWGRGMDYDGSDVGRSSYGTQLGLSVRCVRDN